MTTRREFFKTLGAGILVGIPLEAQRRGGRAFPQDLAAWLHIAEDGAVTVYTGKIEVGQNIRTSLTQVVAEELRAPLASIRMVMGDTDLVPYDAGTFGSQTTPIMAPQLRRAAATAREPLVDLAAERWKADRASLTVAAGKVTGPGGQSVSFGELTRGQKLVRTISPDTPLTPATEWKIAGTSVPKVDGRDIVTGRHKFTSDFKPAGMLYGKVLRPAGRRRQPGSLRPLCRRSHAGRQGGAGRRFRRRGRAHALRRRARPRRPQGRLENQAPARPARTLRAPQEDRQARLGRLTRLARRRHGRRRSQAHATYTTPYIAHVPLEPRAAVAEWKDGKLTVWTGTQRPFGVRAELAAAFGIPEDRVRVIMPDTGSGYGGKHTGDAALEAARLAKAAGKPVKVVWTREEEFTWAYFRPAG